MWGYSPSIPAARPTFLTISWAVVLDRGRLELKGEGKIHSALCSWTSHLLSQHEGPEGHECLTAVVPRPRVGGGGEQPRFHIACRRPEQRPPAVLLEPVIRDHNGSVVLVPRIRQPPSLVES